MKITLWFLAIIFLSGCAIRSVRSSASANDSATQDRNPSSYIENGTYPGEMMVVGKFQLLGAGGDYTPKAGKVTLELQKQGIEGGITGLWSGAKKLILKDKDHEFVFSIPKELTRQDGVISVHKSSAKQTAHLVIKKNRSFIKAADERVIEKCGITGSREVLYKVSQFNMKLNVRIYNDLGSAEINTADLIETERQPVQELSYCQ